MPGYMDLTRFFDLPNLKNTWVTEPGIDMYVRKSVHCFERIIVNEGNIRKDVPRRTLDLANLNAHKPGSGTLTQLLPRIERLASELDLWVRVETVNNERFKQFWRRRGYTETQTDENEAAGSCFWYGPHWKAEMGPYEVLSYRSLYDNRMVFEFIGPDGKVQQPVDLLPNTEPTLRIWVNETLICHPSDEEGGEQ
jgi:hypothetical protein